MNYLYRYAEKKVKEFAGFFKVVALLGARQVGKSSLLRHLYPDYRYITFDPIQDTYGAKQDPDLFLKNFPPPLILDAIQYAPQLIPAIKRFADSRENSGQYFITGSQNISVLKNISESLAGQVGIIKLHPMEAAEESSQAESTTPWLHSFIHHQKLPDQFTAIKECSSLSRILWRGNMPGILDAPDSLVSPYFESYVLTYIERDIRMIENIKDLSDFSRFVRVCAALSSQEINSSHLGREIGITPQTARRWLDLLIQTFQWIELDPYTGNTLKRISGKKKGYLMDTGLASYLLRLSSPEALFSSAHMGPLFETMVVTSLIKTLSLLSPAPIFYHWRTSAGAEVDVVLEHNGKLFPVEIKAKTQLSAMDTRGILSFLETYPGPFGPALIIYCGDESYELSENIFAVPWDRV